MLSVLQLQAAYVTDMNVTRVNGSYSASTTKQGLIILSNLWQNYGGVYGDYCVVVNLATIVVLAIMRVANCLPWLQESLCTCLISNGKLELDGLALWQSGSTYTHHQYLVVYCLFGAAIRRYTGSWEASPEARAVWYAVVLRLLARARGYTLLAAVLLQLDKIPWYCLVAGLITLIISRAYEVYNPWLDSIHSPRTVAEQRRKAMSDLESETSEVVLASASSSKYWPVPSFASATHARLLIFRAQIKAYGFFLPSSCTQEQEAGSSSTDDQFRHGWVDGSCLLSFASLFLAAFCFWGLLTAQDSPLSWRAVGGLLYLQCFLLEGLLSLPAFIYHASKLAEILTDPHDHNIQSLSCLMIVTEEWWPETKRFMHVLVTSGFPFKYESTMLGSRASAFFWNAMGRLEGFELAAYVFLAAVLKLVSGGLLCILVLAVKKVGLGRGFCWACLKLRSQITRLVVVRALFPGFINGVAIDLLNAETALASQKVCARSGLCVQTLKLDEVLARLEAAVQAKGAIHEPCTFFLHTRAASLHHDDIPEDPYLARAIALGLLQYARASLHKLRGVAHANSASTTKGASALHTLLRLLTVYTLDSSVPDAKTKDLMFAVAHLVQKLVEESVDSHWQRYRDRDHLEASFCECVSDTEWPIMVAQLSMELLLVYTGLINSSLDWPHPQLESQVLKNWITARSNPTNIANGVAEASIV